MVNVYVFDITSICIDGEGILRKFALHQKYREQSHNETEFDISEKLIVGQSDDLCCEYNQLGTLFMEVFIFGWWWRSRQSPAHKGLRILRFSIMLWKTEREPTVKLCMGRQIDVVQKSIRTQSFGQNQWWADWIRVEYLPRVHQIAALHQCPRVHVENERKARRIYRTNHLHVDAQRYLMGI